MDDVTTCISSYILNSKSESEVFEWSEKELDKDKLGTSGKTHILEDGSSELIGELFKEENGMFDLDISKCEYKLDTWEKDLNMTLKSITIFTLGLCVVIVLSGFNKLL